MTKWDTLAWDTPPACIGLMVYDVDKPEPVEVVGTFDQFHWFDLLGFCQRDGIHIEKPTRGRVIETICEMYGWEAA